MRRLIGGPKAQDKASYRLKPVLKKWSGTSSNAQCAMSAFDH